MSLQYTVEGADGTNTISANDLAGAFAQQGFKQATLSQDGQTLSLVDPQGGQAEVNIAEYLGAKGKVLGMAPAEGLANYDSVDDGMRRAIGALGSHDDLKRMYLQGQLRDQGIPDAKIVGSGDDFYFFDPKSGKYNALTNKPGADWSDVNGYATKGAELALGLGGSLAGGIAGAAAGGTAGTALAPGAGTVAGGILGGAGGAAAGGALGRGLFDRAAGWLNPDLEKQLYSEEFQQGRLKEAAFDAVGGGLVPGIGAVAPKLFTKGLASGTAKGVGGAVEVTGDTVGKAAGYLGSDATIPKIARSVAENFVPVTGQAQIPAMVMRAGELVPMGLKAANKAANKAYGYLGGEEALAKGVLPGFADETAGQAFAAKVADYTAKKGLVREAPVSWGDKVAAFLGRKAQPVSAVKEAGVKDSIANIAENTRLAGAGRSVGEGLEHLSKAGRVIDGVNSGVVKGGLKAVETVGKEAALAGNVLKQLGTAAAPLENRALLRQALPWASEESQDIWQKMTRPKKTFAQKMGY